MANTKARKAKAETLAKWEGVHAKLVEARIAMSEDCAFCSEEQSCSKCPAFDACGLGPHWDAISSVWRACSDAQTLVDKIRGIKV